MRLDTYDPRKIRSDGAGLPLVAALRKDGAPIFRVAGGGTAGTLIAGTKGGPDADAPAAGGAMPFVRSASEHVEGPFYDTTTTLASNSIQVGPIDVPSFGYMRAIWLTVVAAGGTLGAGALAENYPYSWLQEVNLIDVNGANIIGPVSGYDLYLINRYGGYAWDGDPANTPGTVTTINSTFAIRIPVEVTGWDGFGALANQNSSAAFKLRITIASNATTNTDLFSTAPTTAPTSLRIRAFLEAWSQPEAADLAGNPQATRPPFFGAVQYWSFNTVPIVSGDNTVRLTRLGNWIRNLIFVFTSGSPATRSTGESNLPDPIRLLWDAREWKNESMLHNRARNREVLGYGSLNGVFAYTFTHDQDGHAGYETRDLWVPTTQSTRLELRGSFGASGTLRILTNDVVTPGGAR